MNGLVLLVLLSVAHRPAITSAAITPADTSIYIENVIWPHASQNAV